MPVFMVPLRMIVCLRSTGALGAAVSVMIASSLSAGIEAAVTVTLRGGCGESEARDRN